MSKSFKLKDGDICFDGSKKIEMIYGAEETAQALERRFTTNEGEWFLNGGHGLLYEQIRGKGVSDEAIQMAIINTAAQDKRVKEVISVDINKDMARRHIDINFVCKLVTGEEIKIPFSIK